ncbi:MAG: hypothetical protein AAFW74_08410, partial [Pseudomonadota bacterium]
SAPFSTTSSTAIPTARTTTSPATVTSTVTSTVGIGPRSEGGFGLDVKLEVSLPGIDKDMAAKLVEEAHQVCPYSNATRGALDINPVVV